LSIHIYGMNGQNRKKAIGRNSKRVKVRAAAAAQGRYARY